MACPLHCPRGVAPSLGLRPRERVRVRVPAQVKLPGDRGAFSCPRNCPRQGRREPLVRAWEWQGWGSLLGGFLQRQKRNGTGGQEAPRREEKRDSGTVYSTGSPWFEDEDGVSVLHSERSEHNHITVLEVARYSEHPLAGARVLLLDGPGNIHSIYMKYKPWTESYYDRFAALPALIPPGGPVGILGLAAGSAARAMRHAWPRLDMAGWEWDGAVVQVARDYFDLRELEGVAGAASKYLPLLPMRRAGAAGKQRTGGSSSQGRLTVHVGDALGPSAVVEGGFSGLVVDLFHKGVVIPQLQQAATWQKLIGRMRPGGRIMVNAGGGCVESEHGDDVEGERVMWGTLVALRRALPADQTIMCRRLDGEGGNVMALTVGSPSDLEQWLDYDFPSQVVDSIEEWIELEQFIQSEIDSLGAS